MTSQNIIIVDFSAGVAVDYSYDPPRRLELVEIDFERDEAGLIREVAAEDGQSLQEFLSAAVQGFLK